MYGMKVEVSSSSFEPVGGGWMDKGVGVCFYR